MRRTPFRAFLDDLQLLMSMVTPRIGRRLPLAFGGLAALGLIAALLAVPSGVL